MSTTISDDTPLTKKDFATSNDARWCPMRRLRDLERSPTNTSRIGDSSRKIRGGKWDRVQQSISLLHEHLRVSHDSRACPDGGYRRQSGQPRIVRVDDNRRRGRSFHRANHLLHLLRRNLDINALLFNNRIYGLTKGHIQSDFRGRQKDEKHTLGVG